MGSGKTPIGGDRPAPAPRDRGCTSASPRAPAQFHDDFPYAKITQGRRELSDARRPASEGHERHAASRARTARRAGPNRRSAMRIPDVNDGERLVKPGCHRWSKEGHCYFCHPPTECSVQARAERGDQVAARVHERGVLPAGHERVPPLLLGPATRDRGRVRLAGVVAPRVRARSTISAQMQRFLALDFDHQNPPTAREFAEADPAAGPGRDQSVDGRRREERDHGMIRMIERLERLQGNLGTLLADAGRWVHMPGPGPGEAKPQWDQRETIIFRPVQVHEYGSRLPLAARGALALHVGHGPGPHGARGEPRGPARDADRDRADGLAHPAAPPHDHRAPDREQRPREPGRGAPAHPRCDQSGGGAPPGRARAHPHGEPRVRQRRSRPGSGRRRAGECHLPLDTPRADAEAAGSVLGRFRARRRLAS